MRKAASGTSRNESVSVVVPILQSASILSMFLTSLLNTLSPGHQPILVDDGCSLDAREVIEGSRKLLEQRFDLVLLRHGTPHGDGAATNEALTHATNDVTVRLESDAIMQGDWIGRLCEPLVEPDVAAVAGVLIYPQSGGINHAGLTFYEMVGRHCFLNAQVDDLPVSPFAVQSITFGFTAFRTEAVRKLGGFDEQFHQGYDDLDLSLRLSKDAGRLLVVPAVRAYHWELSSGPHRAAGRKRNLAVFWDRWGKVIVDDLWTYLERPLRSELMVLQAGSRGVIGIDLHSDRVGAKRFWREAEERCGLILLDRLDLAHRAAGDGAIALPLVLGADGFHNPDPILFLVDNFARLRGNHLFFERRSALGVNDLIVDLHANVIYARRLLAGSWPGEKIR